MSTERPFGASRLLRRLCAALAALAAGVSAVFLAAMVCIVFAEVYARYVRRSPLFWSSEVAQLLTVYVALLGGAYAYRHRLHIGVSVLVDRFPSRVRNAWRRMLDVLIGGFGVAMIVYTADLLGQVGHHVLPATQVTVFWAYLPLILCGALLCAFALEGLLLGPLPDDDREGAP